MFFQCTYNTSYALRYVFSPEATTHRVTITGASLVSNSSRPMDLVMTGCCQPVGAVPWLVRWSTAAWQDSNTVRLSNEIRREPASQPLPLLILFHARITEFGYSPCRRLRVVSLNEQGPTKVVRALDWACLKVSARGEELGIQVDPSVPKYPGYGYRPRVPENTYLGSCKHDLVRLGRLDNIRVHGRPACASCGQFDLSVPRPRVQTTSGHTEASLSRTITIS